VAAAGVATTWTNDLLGGTGDWAVGANWASNPYAPTNAGDTAVLGVGSAVSTVTISQNMSLGAITFTNPSSFIVADAGKTLTLDNFGGGAVITVNSGTSNAISTAVSLKDKSTFNVTGSTVLSLSNIISSLSGANTLTKNGTGTLVELPGSQHAGACGMTFADGHSTVHKWQTGQVVAPVTYKSVAYVNCVNNADLAWLAQHTPH